ncbi:hypothetical protein ACWEQG_18915 [Microbispora sp. NPDC004025]
MSPNRQDAPARPAPAGPQHPHADIATVVSHVLGPEPAEAPAEAASAPQAPAIPAVGCPTAGGEIVLYSGKTTASYFWDDGSGINGDTGAPASGKPMQKGLAASPSWPMGTKGYVIYKGKKAEFFVGDRGPGVPSSSGVMLDLDGKTFAELTGGTWDTDSLTVEDAGGLGHIPVQYVITQWGKGLGKTGAPKPFSTGAYGVRDHAEPPPPCPTAAPAPSAAPAAPQDAAPASTPGVKENQAPAAPAASVAPSVAPSLAPSATQSTAQSTTQSTAQSTAPSAAPAPPAEPAARIQAAGVGMFPLSATTAGKGGGSPAPSAAAKTTAMTTAMTTAKTTAKTVKTARTGEATASPAFTPASAASGQLEEAAVPAFSVAIVVCALVAVGAKAVLSRPAHAHAGRHRKR